VTIFLIEHVMKAILGLSDKVIVLNYGEKIAEGPPQEVANDPQVITAYLGQKRLT
jgi:branched-chain amino acid transport system ATP-binding protein